MLRGRSGETATASRALLKVEEEGECLPLVKPSGETKRKEAQMLKSVAVRPKKNLMRGV